MPSKKQPVGLLVVRYGLGAAGDLEREREEQARRYFDEHGEWPQEQPAQGRRWALPPGVVTPEQEESRRVG